MLIRGLLAAFMLGPALLFGQPGAGTVTVTSSQSSNPRPDQAVFSVSVGSGIDRNLDDIVAALGNIGISAADLSDLSLQSGTSTQNAPLVWTFQLIVPLSKLKDTTASLTSVKKAIAQNDKGLTLSFTLQRTQVSAQQSQNCDFGRLMTDARTEAQNIAGAAGVTSDTVVGITSSITQSTPDCLLTVSFGLPVSRSGPNTITIAASRMTNPQPDQVLIGINVTSDATSGPDDISAALAAAGIGGADLTGVNNGTIYDALGLQTPPVLQWSFALTAPLAKLQSTLALLDAAKQTVPQQNSALSFSFYIEGLQSSQQSQPVCREAGLLSDARSQAQAVAAAAGVSVGAILNMSDQAAPAQFVPSVILGYASFPYVITAPTYSCSLSVQFQLL